MLSPLTEKQELVYLSLVDAAKEESRPKADAIKEKRIQTEAPKLAKRQNISVEKAESVICHRSKGTLLPEDEIVFRSGPVSVAEVLSNLGKYDGQACADPLEPEEGISKAKFYANIDKDAEKPVVHSMLHGGCNYFLQSAAKTATSVCGVTSLPLEKILQLIEETEDHKTILNGWIDKTRGMNAVSADTVMRAVSEKTGVKLRPLSRDLKTKQCAWQAEKAEARRKNISAKFKAEGLTKISYLAESTGKTTMQVAKILFNDANPAHDLVLRHGTELVSVVKGRPCTVRMIQRIYDSGGEYPEMPILHRYTTETLRHRIEQIAVLYKANNYGEMVPSKWPTDILKGLGAQHKIAAKQLTGIVEHPFVDKNYQAFVEQGYDPKTGLYTMFDSDIVTGLQTSPGIFDATIAYNFLKDEVMADFPFASELDVVGAIAALLTALQRKMIVGDSGCPGFLFDAPTQSTGKTTLAQIFSYSIYNRPAAATSWSDSDEELGKHILAILREGHSCVLFDNLPNGAALKSNELAKAMTGNSYSKRILGENTTATVPSSVLWLFTGNNVSVVGDFNTRILPIRLDAKMADPDRRKFSRVDIGTWCMENRGKIIDACLTIIMASKDFKPDVSPTRYSEWDNFVRLPLLNITDIDIAELFERNKAADPEFEGRRVLLEVLYDVFGEQSVTATEIRDKAYGESGDYCREKTGLNDALADIFPKGLPTSRALGKWLGKLKGAIIGDYQLTATKGTTRENRGRQCWCVSKV
jgi:hypothetical protein